MSEADDLYADLYGEDAEPSVNAAPSAPKTDAVSAGGQPGGSTGAGAATGAVSASASAVPAAAGAPAAGVTAAASMPSLGMPAAGSTPDSGMTSFIPGRPAPPPQDSAEARSAAAARGEHIAPQDLPDEG